MNLRGLLAGMVMLASAFAALAMKPTQYMAKQHPIDLQALIPEHLGDWAIEKAPTIAQINPEIQEKINRIYSQLVQRTYVNKTGQRIMLSIAYGGDQSDALRVHRPEVCYGAQGFSIGQQSMDHLKIGQTNLPVKRMIAVMGERVEPITYWMTVGEKVALTGWQHKMMQLSYGANRVVPDGMVFRVSAIGRDAEASFKYQEDFLSQLYTSLPSVSRSRIFGS
ncbi:EpsI family protein [Chitinivorax tropicus]|uniref:EpsI family protein n=1 Tax=Chitinivorax tropicus TaxID=714531 RepID=A0A840MMD8_9PROT|nr:exosortase-associated protein EpsI, B-type [Chitinivorax tropicus]MBB5019580.1 EpsI family protein [Chitinivorax tropicus]